MSIMNSLRKGLRFFLMSFGVSSPNKSSPVQSTPIPGPKPSAGPSKQSSTEPPK